ncbi:MAG: DUF4136 domain-containing protein [Myxococcota bacterium]
MLIALVVGGCQTFNVRSDWDDTVRFEELRRFHFEAPPTVEGANPFADNTLMRKRIRTAVEAVLGERGFRPAASRARADFVITYQVLLEEELRVDSTGVDIGAGGWRRPYGYGVFGSTTTRVNNFQEATLILDVLDPEKNELTWRGWGQRMLSTKDRDRSEERLREGVRAILDRFPPGRE